MKIVEAVYQEGILKPLQHLDLPENSRIRLQVIPAEEVLAENLFKHRLLELGLLREIRVPFETKEKDRTPIEVNGQPLSQAIINERR